LKIVLARHGVRYPPHYEVNNVFTFTTGHERFTWMYLEPGPDIAIGVVDLRGGWDACGYWHNFGRRLR